MVIFMTLCDDFDYVFIDVDNIIRLTTSVANPLCGINLAILNGFAT